MRQVGVDYWLALMSEELKNIDLNGAVVNIMCDGECVGPFDVV